MQSLAKNTFYKLLLNIFTILIPLIIGPYALRVLGPDAMGEIYYSETVFQVFFIFSCFGIYEYGIRELSKIRDNPKQSEKLFNELFFISILTSMITIIIFISFIFFRYGGSEDFSILMVLSLNMISNVFYIEWVVEAYENYKFITIKTIIIRAIYITLLILLVRNPSDYLIYIYLIVFYSFFNNIISYVYVRKKFNISFRNLNLRKHLPYLVAVVIMANANILFTQLDKLMIGEFLDKTKVAYYTLPQSVAGVVNGVIRAIVTVSIPRLSYFIAEDKDKYKELLNKIMAIFMTVLIPVCIGLFVLSDKAILIYGGSKYVSSISTMKIFSIYLFTLGIEYMLTNQVLYINKKEKLITISIFLAGMVNLVSNTILVALKVKSIDAFISTTLLSNVILIAIEYLYIKYKLDISINLINKEYLKYTILCLLFIPINYIINYFIKNIIIATLAVVFICFSLYCIALYKMKNPLVQMVICEVKSKIKSRL